MTMIYLLPELDVAGNLPVWSVCMVSAALWILVSMALIFLGFGTFALLLFCSFCIVVSILVDRIPCRCCFMCPFCVSSDSGWCLLTFATVSDGHVMKKPILMAFIHVSFVGYIPLPHVGI